MDHLDSRTPTELFSIDRVRLTVERDGTVSYQTSGSEIFTFQGYTVRPAKWVHLAVVHQKGSGAQLYENGALVSSVSSHFPRSSASTATAIVGASPHSTSLSILSIGSTKLYAERLSTDVLYMIALLSPHHSGANLLDDPLDRFLSYPAKSRLSLRAEEFAKKTEATRSELAKFLSSMNSPALDEQAFVLSISACGVDASGSTVANATPRREIAQLRGAVVLTGQGFAETFGLVAGCTVALRLVEIASDETNLFHAVTIVVELFRQSWRNAEEMERDRGFEILAMLLRGKASLVTVPTLNILLSLVGVDVARPS